MHAAAAAAAAPVGGVAVGALPTILPLQLAKRHASGVFRPRPPAVGAQEPGLALVGRRRRWRGLDVIDHQAAEDYGEGGEVNPVRGDVLDQEGEEEGVHVGREEGEVKHRRVSRLEEEGRPAVHHRQAGGDW